jgi:hypothetical protein
MMWVHAGNTAYTLLYSLLHEWEGWRISTASEESEHSSLDYEIQDYFHLPQSKAVLPKLYSANPWDFMRGSEESITVIAPARN